MVDNPLKDDLHGETCSQSVRQDNFSARQLILPLYGILTLVVLGLTVFLVFKGVSPSGFAPPLNGTITPAMTKPNNTFTKTFTPTIRATFTPKPSHTPTIIPTDTYTPTSTPIPSLTPAFPFIDNDRYYLLDWTPMIASKTISLMEAYPNTLSIYARGKDDGGYFASFSFAVFAQREALFRIPDAHQANDWHWRLVYNLARTGDEQAGDAVIHFFAQLLNNDLVRLEDLSEWGNTQKPPAQITLSPIAAPAGYLSKNLVKFSAEDNGGVIFLLLETSEGFIAYPLSSHFDFKYPTFIDYFYSDLTGDGAKEVVIYRSPSSGSTKYPLPEVFDLSHQPPRKLPFAEQRPPEIGLPFRTLWMSLYSPNGQSSLDFVDTVFPACPLNIRHRYQWNGLSFEFIDSEYSIEPTPQLFRNCSLVIDHAVKTWGLDVAIDLMESLIEDWSTTPAVNNEHDLIDFLDEWRYRLGLYYALMGSREKAINYMEKIIASPAIPDNDWISDARIFLETYQSQHELYQTCLLIRLCDPKLAFQTLLAAFSPEDYNQATTILQEAGVLIRSSGFFDFDGDQNRERWLSLRHKIGGKLELWIIKPYQGEIRALFVDYILTNIPSISYLDETVDPPLIKVEPDITFILERVNRASDILITHKKKITVFSADLTQQALDSHYKSLLTGGDPVHINMELLNLKKSSMFTCNYLLCPQYLYTLGLANELAGNDRRAVEIYLDLWRQYPSSPFTTMARLKLGGGALPPTATPTPLPTETLTPTTSPTFLSTTTPTDPTSTTTDTLTPTSTDIDTASQNEPYKTFIIPGEDDL